MTDITIVDKNNETKMAEGLLYFNVKDTNKKYLIYTLNEPINDKIIIYAINVAEAGQEVEQIGEEASKIIKDIISKVSNASELDNIEFLNMTNVSFSVGNQDVKKFGINPEKKQAFIERQLTSVANKQKNNDTPAVGGSPFFNAEVATPAQEEAPAVQTEQVNIFDNPMQPAFQEEVPKEVPAINETTVAETTVESAPVVETQDNVVNSSIEETPVVEAAPEVTTTEMVEKNVELTNNTEKVIVISQEQLDIITNAVNSINAVISNIKVIEKEEVPSLPQEVVQETQSDIPTGNVLEEEAVLTPVTEQIIETQPEVIVESAPQIVMTPETTQLQPVGEVPVLGSEMETPIVGQNLENVPVVDPNTTVTNEIAVAPSMENSHSTEKIIDSSSQVQVPQNTEVQAPVQLQPVGEAPVLPTEIVAPVQEQPAIETVAPVQTPSSVIEPSVINEVPAIEVVSNSEIQQGVLENNSMPTQSVVSPNVEVKAEEVQPVETVPTVENQTQATSDNIDLEVYLPDMPALNDLENSPVLAETGQPENEANQAVQIGSRPTETPAVSQEIPAIDSIDTTPSVETGEEALVNAMDQIDNNNYVASAGNNVTVQNPGTSVQEAIPVVMPTGSSAPVQTTPTQEVYGPGSLTPETPVGVQNARPIEGMNAPLEQPKTLTLAA